MSELRHDNVLRVFGYTRLPPNQNHHDDRRLPFALVYPVHENGSLQDYLFNRPLLAEDERVKIVSFFKDWPGCAVNVTS